ncbi:hypothetical protein ACFLVB_04710 [Chloroflexota bacterium]
MLKFFIIFTPISGLATLFINSNFAEVEHRIWVFLVFGLLYFGIVWGKNNIDEIIDGIFYGLFVGIIIAVTVALADTELVSTGSYGMNLLLIFINWILPISLYTGGIRLLWLA